MLHWKYSLCILFILLICSIGLGCESPVISEKHEEVTLDSGNPFAPEPSEDANEVEDIEPTERLENPFEEPSVPESKPVEGESFESIGDFRGMSPKEPQLGLTYHQSDGNRIVGGKGQFPKIPFAEALLKGEPLWVVGSSLSSTKAAFCVALKDGSLQAFVWEAGKLTPKPLSTQQLPAGMPPALVAQDGKIEVLGPPSAKASTTTHPVFLPSTKALAFVEKSGDLVLWKGKELARASVKALPDARILVDERERLLLLTHPTDKYGHGVLGDKIEATGITLLETKPKLRVVKVISIPSPRVVEGISPIWVDLDGDNNREIIVTQADASQGAQIVAYHEDGRIFATGPAIGQGYRWRHQLAVAPFGPKGELELVDVLTPHLGKQTEFFQLKGGKLQVMTRVGGYTSHLIGSRNLDSAVAGDFDGDGKMELVLPSSDYTSIGAIQHTPQGAKVIWQLQAGSRVLSNLSGLSVGGRLLLAAGLEGKRLRVWGTLR